ncbi:MAG TPA: hypothetical protein VMU02_09360, partial [bacterium]|nr:hypothetical protein [bacterium]
MADTGNNRIDTYKLDGTSPGSFGSSALFEFFSYPERVAVDSRGIVYATNGDSRFPSAEIVRYDTENADGEGVGFLAPIRLPSNELQSVRVTATAGQYRLSFEGESTGDLPYNASAAEIQSALAALPSIGAGNVAAKQDLGISGLGGAFVFQGTLSHINVPQIVASNGTVPLSGGTAEVATLNQGGVGPLTGAPTALVVEPDPDGVGPETDMLYVGNSATIQLFGSGHPPGLTTPPAAADETSGTGTAASTLAAEPSTGRLYEASGARIFVLDTVGPPPTASLDSISGITAHSAEVHGTINPNGPPATSYHLEFSTDGTTWRSMPEVELGAQEAPQAITVALQPAAGGLLANTTYHVRLVATRKLASPVISSALTFTTLGAAPLVETTGSPIRSATTALISGRVDPQGSATTYRFEYGSEGSCETSPCALSEGRSMGSGSSYQLVAQQLEGLAPNTVYHYRVVAENGQGSPVYGGDMTMSTRSSDEPLSHGHFPGPPGSDRAYEQVSLPDAGGNPVSGVAAISDNGERVVYISHGGNPISSYGDELNEVFSERTASGWQNKNIFPSREESVGSSWLFPYANSDLSSFVAANGSGEIGHTALYRFSPNGSPSKIWGPPGEQGLLEPLVSDDLSLVAIWTKVAGVSHIFDVSSGTPEEIDQLPDGSFPACGAIQRESEPTRYPHWLSADGKLSFFRSRGNSCGSPEQLYVRDLETGQTKRVSPAPVSGPSCQALFIRSTPGAAFFSTQARLAASDTASSQCGSGGSDIYRYDLASESVRCLTCVGAGVEADVDGTVAVAEDGSRVYFHSNSVLVPGGGPGIYRVNVTS